MSAAPGEPLLGVTEVSVDCGFLLRAFCRSLTLNWKTFVSLMSERKIA